MWPRSIITPFNTQKIAKQYPKQLNFAPKTPPLYFQNNPKMTPAVTRHFLRAAADPRRRRTLPPPPPHRVVAPSSSLLPLLVHRGEER